MVERAYPSASNKVNIVCQRCKKAKAVDVSKFANTGRTVKIHSTCSCGNKWTSIIERRRLYRKTVNLPGTYTLTKDEKIVDRGRMKVVDISGGGVRLKLEVERNLQAGDCLNIEFHLDDSQRTLIKKSIEIRNINGVYIGTSFRFAVAYDPALGYYLMS